MALGRTLTFRCRRKFKLEVTYDTEANNSTNDFHQAFYFDVRNFKEWLRFLPMPSEFTDYEQHENVSLLVYMDRCFAHIAESDPPEDPGDNLLAGLHALSDARRNEIKTGSPATELGRDMKLLLSLCSPAEREAACDQPTFSWSTVDAARILTNAFDERALDQALRNMLTHERDMLDSLNASLFFLDSIPSLDYRRVQALLAYTKTWGDQDKNSVAADPGQFRARIVAFYEDREPVHIQTSDFSDDFKDALVSVFSDGHEEYLKGFNTAMDKGDYGTVVSDIMCTYMMKRDVFPDVALPRTQMFRFRTHLDYIDFIIDGGVVLRKTVAMPLDIDTVRGAVDVSAVLGEKHINDNVRVKVHWKKVHDDGLVVSNDFIKMWLRMDAARMRWFRTERSDVRSVASETAGNSRIFYEAYVLWNNIAQIVRDQGTIKRLLDVMENANRIATQVCFCCAKATH